MNNMWDQKYNSSEYLYGKEPNEFFASELKKLKPSLMLLPAEGEGRNAVYAASHGWKVHAFDSSKVGQEKALSLAAERKVNILYSITDIQDFDAGDIKYDAIGFFYAHFPLEMRNDFFNLVQKSLAPGGKIILEGFHKKQFNRNTGGPKNSSMLFSVEELGEIFSDLHIEKLSEETIELDEADGHKGEADVVRMVASKIDE